MPTLEQPREGMEPIKSAFIEHALKMLQESRHVTPSERMSIASLSRLYISGYFFQMEFNRVCDLYNKISPRDFISSKDIF